MEEKEFKFCGNCGAKIAKDADFCKECGKFTEEKKAPAKSEPNKLMAILAYIIAPVPYFAEKNDKFAVYHAKQGMNLFCLVVAWTILDIVLTSVIKVQGSCGSYWGWDLGNYCKVTPWWVTWPLALVGLAIGVLGVIGIINVVNNKEKELPIIGKYKIFK